MLAAAGIVALETMIDRLVEDHLNARALAEGLGLVAGLNVRPVKRRTNMVVFDVDGDPSVAVKFAAAMKDRGVIANRADRRRFAPLLIMGFRGATSIAWSPPRPRPPAKSSATNSSPPLPDQAISTLSRRHSSSPLVPPS